jgi:hypothetical protein
MSAASKSGREDAGPARQRFLLTFFAEKKVSKRLFVIQSITD